MEAEEEDDPKSVRTCPGGEPRPPLLLPRATAEAPLGLPAALSPRALPRGLAAADDAVGGVRGPPRVCTPPDLVPSALEPEPEPDPEPDPATPPPPPLLLVAGFFSLVFLPLTVPLGFFFFFLAAGAPAVVLELLLLLLLPSVGTADSSEDGGSVAREELRVEVDDEAAGLGRLEERPHLPPCWMPVVCVARRTVRFSLSESLPPISASRGMSSGLVRLIGARARCGVLCVGGEGQGVTSLMTHDAVCESECSVRLRMHTVCEGPSMPINFKPCGKRATAGEKRAASLVAAVYCTDGHHLLTTMCHRPRGDVNSIAPQVDEWESHSAARV